MRSAVCPLVSYLALGALASEPSLKPVPAFGQPPLVIEPLSGGAPYATVFFLHGLGDSGHGWRGLIPQIDGEIPGLGGKIRYILPHADPQVVSVAPPGQPLPAWFDILRLDEFGPEDIDGLEKARQQIEGLIGGEIAAGTPPERIVLAGFSQGASLALHVAMRTERPIAGAVSLSGWLSLMDAYPSSLSERAAKGEKKREAPNPNTRSNPSTIRPSHTPPKPTPPEASNL